jgi:GntR family transcriptional regulator, vanillate catabolism transcriptional regulator
MRVTARREASAADAAEEAERPGGRANLDDHIYEHVKQMIANRAFLPGQRIVPEQLARDMGVSRTPMLSALKRLSQEQLLEWRSRRGVFVRHLSRRELALIFELREVLEGLAARRATATIERRQIEQFKSLFVGLETTETLENRHAYMRQDYLFHSGLLEIAGSQPLSHTMNSVNIMVSAFEAGLVRSIREGLAEHEEIFDALAKRDPVAAEVAMRMHLHRSAVHLHHEADVLERSRAALRLRAGENDNNTSSWRERP